MTKRSDAPTGEAAEEAPETPHCRTRQAGIQGSCQSRSQSENLIAEPSDRNGRSPWSMVTVPCCLKQNQSSSSRHSTGPHATQLRPDDEVFGGTLGHVEGKVSAALGKDTVQAQHLARDVGIVGGPGRRGTPLGSNSIAMDMDAPVTSRTKTERSRRTSTACEVKASTKTWTLESRWTWKPWTCRSYLASGRW